MKKDAAVFAPFLGFYCFLFCFFFVLMLYFPLLLALFSCFLFRLLFSDQNLSSFFFSHRMHWKGLFSHNLPTVAHRGQQNHSCVNI